MTAHVHVASLFDVFEPFGPSVEWCRCGAMRLVTDPDGEWREARR